MTVAGYIISFIIGAIMGVLGGGGSILTVPLFVYWFGIEPVRATGYSLFMVGVTSLASIFVNKSKQPFSLRVWCLFGLPSVLAVLTTRKFLISELPESYMLLGGDVSKRLLILGLFAILMISASVFMIRGSREAEPQGHMSSPAGMVLLGLLIGGLTSLVGAGGGFLIVPALLWVTSLGMRQAIATSLMIIASNSLIGFAGDLTNYEMEWRLLLPMTMFSVAGVFAGQRLASRLPEILLRRAFGWMMVAMGLWIVLRELTYHFA